MHSHTDETTLYMYFSKASGVATSLGPGLLPSSADSKPINTVWKARCTTSSASEVEAPRRASRRSANCLIFEFSSASLLNRISIWLACSGLNRLFMPYLFGANFGSGRLAKLLQILPPFCGDGFAGVASGYAPQLNHQKLVDTNHG